MYYKVLDTNGNVIDALYKIKYAGYRGNQIRMVSSIEEAIGIFNHDNSVIFHITNNEDLNRLPQCDEAINATLETISESEYNLIIASIGGPTPVILTHNFESNELENIKASVISKMNAACQLAITGGFDIVSNDSSHHVDLTLEDQINLLTIKTNLLLDPSLQTVTFHFKGEAEDLFSKELMLEIINRAESWKNENLSYYNRLKRYINSFTTNDKIKYISEITYGIALPTV